MSSFTVRYEDASGIKRGITIEYDHDQAIAGQPAGEHLRQALTLVPDDAIVTQIERDGEPLL